MAADASFYDKNWTLLNKINGIRDWLKENNIDIEHWHWKEEWISGETYNKFDVVAYINGNGIGYFICIKDVDGSNETPLDDTLNWKLLFAAPVARKTYAHSIFLKAGTYSFAFTIYLSQETPLDIDSFCQLIKDDYLYICSGLFGTGVGMGGGINYMTYVDGVNIIEFDAYDKTGSEVFTDFAVSTISPFIDTVREV